MSDRKNEEMTFDIPDLETDVLPGGASEPVLHAGAVVAGIILVWSTAAK